MNFIPDWSKSFLHIMFVSFVNPFILAINFNILWIPLAEDVATNVGQLPPRSIPIWFMSGILLAIIMKFLQFQLARLLSKISYAEFRRRDMFAQLPYLLFVFFWFLLVTGEIEGNIMGFIYFPAYIILTAIAVPISLALSVIMFRRAKQNSRSKNQ